MNLDLFLQLLKIKFDMPIDFAYDVGKIRLIYQNERLEKSRSISHRLDLGEVFSESGNSKRVKSYFKKKNIEKLKKFKKFKNSKKKTQKCIKKKIVEFSLLFYFWNF